jgi:hypothetical protein
MSEVGNKTFAPANASFRRKTLGIRVVLVNIGVLILMILLGDWVADFGKENGFPKWFDKVLILPFVIILILAGASIHRGLHDAVNYLVPNGKLKEMILKQRGEKTEDTPETISDELEQFGYSSILFPLYMLGWAIGIGLLLLLIFGGGALLLAGIGSFLSSTPIWATIIIILLIVILNKL